MTTSETAMAFVAAINEKNLEHLAALMTDDHVFVDALDHRVEGKHRVVQAWRAYFAMIPDYEIKIGTLLEKEGEVAMFGRAAGTYVPEQTVDPKNRWEIPAAWLAEIRREKISVWRIFADTLPIRRLMGIER